MTNAPRLRTSPSPIVLQDHRLWKNDLEFDYSGNLQEVSEDGFIENWITKLTGAQMHFICADLGLPTEGSPQEKRQRLFDNLAPNVDRMREFAIVSRFIFRKSKIAMIEVAEEHLHPDDFELCKVESRTETGPDDNAGYDCTALVFGLFCLDRYQDHFKNLYHFNKIHKKGFASLILDETPETVPNQPIRNFLSTINIQRIVREYSRENDKHGSVTQLQGIWPREGRTYVFIRRSNYSSKIMVEREIEHGKHPEWVVLDFSADGRQVNICSDNVREPKELATLILSAYFEEDMTLVNEETPTSTDTILSMIARERTGEGFGLVEVALLNSPLDGSSDFKLSNTDSASLVESLAHFTRALGDPLESILNINWIKILYRGKRVGIQFEATDDNEDHYVVRYTDQRLNAFERRMFEEAIRNDYGIRIISTEKR